MAPGGPWDEFPIKFHPKRGQGNPFGDIFDFWVIFAQTHCVSVLNKRRCGWLPMSLCGNHAVSLCGSRTVSLCGNHTVSLCGNHTVSLCGNHTVSLCGNHTVSLLSLIHI